MVILYGFLYCVGLWSCDFRQVMRKTTLELYETSSQLKLVQEGYLLYIVQGAFESRFPQLLQVYIFLLKNIHIELSLNYPKLEVLVLIFC
jgi:hypothetical protein